MPSSYHCHTSIASDKCALDIQVNRKSKYIIWTFLVLRENAPCWNNILATLRLLWGIDKYTLTQSKSKMTSQLRNCGEKKKFFKYLNRSAQKIGKVPRAEYESICNKMLSSSFCVLCGKSQTVEASRWPGSQFHYTYWLLPGLLLHVMATSITDLVSFIV